MGKKIIVHTPDLNELGGKSTLYRALQPFWGDEVQYFVYGRKGKKEGKWSLLTRIIHDFRSFNKLLRKENPAVFILNASMDSKSYWRDWIFLYLAQRRDIKSLVFWHGWKKHFEEKVSRKFTFHLQRTYLKASEILVLAEDYKSKLRDWGYKGKISIGKTTIDTELIQRAKHVQRKRGEKFRVLFLARIEKYKGIWEALEAAEKLSLEHDDFEFWIAGEGTEMAHVKRWVQEKQLNQVKFFGYVQGEEKYKLFEEADLYWFPSYTEGLPISVIEAMVFGLPLIATTPGGMAAFFEDNKMGKILTQNTPEEIAEKTQELFKKREIMAEMGKYNREYSLSIFHPKKIAADMTEIYSRLANS